MTMWCEALSTKSVDAGFTPGYVPTPKQVLLHASKARYLLYGGAAGGAKSRGIREDAYRFCRSNPGVTVGLFRRTFPELRDTHMLKIRQEWPSREYRLVKSDNTVYFTNGSTLIFGHCQNPDDVYRYLGTEYDRIYIDELVTFPEDVYDMLCSRLRSTQREMVTRCVAASNPGGIGHNWVKARWIDRDAVDEEGQPRDLSGYDFIRSLLNDNPHINYDEYVATLRGLPPDKQRAYLLGDWDSFIGQYFKQWRRDVHVVEPFAIPDNWPRAVGLDYGGTAPFAALWLALDPSAHPRRVIFYREHYQAGWTLKSNVERILDLSFGERIRGWHADPSMFARTQEEGNRRVSLADQAARYGLHLVPADNERISGWEALSELLTIRDDGQPGLYVFDNCANLIRTLPTLVRDQKNVEDVADGQEDHAADGARYGIKGVWPMLQGGKATVGVPTARMVA